MRICSLLPGATEMAFALGLGDHIVGVTHECDYPADAKNKPVVVRGAIDSSRMSSREIDRKIGELLQGGKGLYTIDERAFVDAAPDIILTQGLCDVCALDYEDVVRATRLLPQVPEILSLNPHNLTDILDDLRRIGAITQRADAAELLIQELNRRVRQIGYAEPSYRPRVVCLEWFEPLYTAGHWVPEMVALAGGFDVLGHKGEASSKVTWREVVDSRPDVILLMPCGFDVRRTIRESTPLRALDGWHALPAVKAGNVFALNGNAYFSRPGPRLFNGLEILARIIHPEQITDTVASEDIARLQ